MTKFDSAPMIDDTPEMVRGVSAEARVDFVGKAALGSAQNTAGGEPGVEVLDMRGASIADVEASLASTLMAGDVVLHGSGGIEAGLIEEFDPSVSSIGGKKPSIYATDDIETAIFNAVLDKHSEAAKVIRRMDGGEGASSGMIINEDGVPKFRIPANMAKAIKHAIELGPESEEWKRLFRDGAVYVLPKDGFTQDSPRTDGADYPTDHEWNSQEATKPEEAVVVSAELVKDVLRFDGDDSNVEVIDSDNGVFIANAQEQFSGMIGADREVVGIEDLGGLAGDSSERVEFLDFARESIGDARLPREEFIRRISELYEEFLDRKYI